MTPAPCPICGADALVDNIAGFQPVVCPCVPRDELVLVTMASNTASCRRCRGVFDVTYSPDTREGFCPGCQSMWRIRVEQRLARWLLRRGWTPAQASNRARSWAKLARRNVL